MHLKHLIAGLVCCNAAQKEAMGFVGLYLWKPRNEQHGINARLHTSTVIYLWPNIHIPQTLNSSLWSYNLTHHKSEQIIQDTKTDNIRHIFDVQDWYTVHDLSAYSFVCPDVYYSSKRSSTVIRQSGAWWTALLFQKDKSLQNELIATQSLDLENWTNSGSDEFQRASSYYVDSPCVVVWQFFFWSRRWEHGPGKGFLKIFS